MSSVSGARLKRLPFLRNEGQLLKIEGQRRDAGSLPTVSVKSENHHLENLLLYRYTLYIFSIICQKRFLEVSGGFRMFERSGHHMFAEEGTSAQKVVVYLE